jgi:hypothetical protein
VTRDSRPLFEREIGALYQKFYAELEIASEVDHPGEKGGRIEQVVADLLRKVLPTKYEVKTNQFLVDCTGKVSRECDVVIIDRTRYFDFFYNYVPIELTYGVIEVKKNVRAKESIDFRRKFDAFRELNFRGRFSVQDENLLRERKFHIIPPAFCLFSMQSEFSDFERFVAWFSTDPFCNKRFVPDGGYDPGHTPNISLAGSLDFGFMRNDSPLSRSFCTISDDPDEHTFAKRVGKNQVKVSGKKALMFILMELEFVLGMKKTVPFFDSRSYLESCVSLNTYMQPDQKLWSKYLSEIAPETGE